MAKKKRRVTHARSRGRSGGGGTGWKKSKAVAGILIGAIVIIWIGIFSSFWGKPAPTYVNYPWTYVSEEPGAEPIIIRADSDKKQRAPFSKDGLVYWDAYQCNNPDCPGRSAEGKPYVFPHVIPFYKKRLEEGKPLELTPEEYQQMEQSGGEMMMGMEMEMYAEPKCPKCEAAKLDPMNVEQYDTPEGKKMKEELMKKYEEERAKRDKK